MPLDKLSNHNLLAQRIESQLQELNSQNLECCYTKALTCYLDQLLRTFLSITACCTWENIYYPFCRRIRSCRIRPAQKRFWQYSKQQNRELQRPFEEIGQKLKNSSVHESYLCKILSYGYQQLETLPPCCQNSSTKKIVINNFTPTFLVEKTCETLIGLGQYLAGLYVHGSHAIGDPVPGYSDFDCGAWVQKDVCQSAVYLRDLRHATLQHGSAVYLIDFSQHHELFWFSEYDFLTRQTSIYPNSLFNEAGRICGLSELEITDPATEQKKSEIQFLTILANILAFTAQHSWHEWYFLKSYLSHVSLLPALYYQKNDEIISKAEAIIRMKSELPQTLEIFETLTKIRSNWQEWGAAPGGVYQSVVSRSPNFVRYFYSMRQKTPQHVLELLGNEFPQKVVQLIAQLLDELKSE